MNICCINTGIKCASTIQNINDIHYLIRNNYTIILYKYLVLICFRDTDSDELNTNIGHMTYRSLKRYESDILIKVKTVLFRSYTRGLV